MNNSLAIILAGGRGTRMNMNVPKPIVKVNNRSIVSWLIDDFKKNATDVVLVINPDDKDFFNKYDNIVDFVYQANPKGTGHAVMQAVNFIKNYKYIYVFVGDSPFVGSNYISMMKRDHIKNNSDLTILSALFKEKKFPYARIIRNQNQKITGCIEEIELREKQNLIDELFCSHYFFNSNILLKYLTYLKPNPKTEEIYFTDVINELIKDKKEISSIIVDDWKRLVGLNTKEDLEWMESQNMI